MLVKRVGSDTQSFTFLFCGANRMLHFGYWMRKTKPESKAAQCNLLFQVLQEASAPSLRHIVHTTIVDVSIPLLGGSTFPSILRAFRQTAV
eukprot:scaffold7414_cov116-Cylindrotheca_fusiformis.AAC.6